MTVRLELPYHLRKLAGVDGEIAVAVEGRVTLRSVLDAVEALHPVLRGTVREYAAGGGMGERRAYLRFFAGEEDLSFVGLDAELPEAVQTGEEALLVVGAVAGGSVAGGSADARS